MSSASVTVDGELLGRIGTGLVVLVGVAVDDDERDADYLINKTVNLRIFPDEEGRFNHSAAEIGAGLLVVSQFTLYAETRKGRRPSFTRSAPPELAETLFNKVVDLFAGTGLKTATGRFQAHMQVSLDNDGPVTIMIDSSDRARPRRG